MYAEISAAIQSAKALGDLLKAAQGLSNYNEFVTAVYEVNAKLMDATGVALQSQEKHSALIARVAELEEELRAFKERQNDAARYQLEATPYGSYVYRLKRDMAAGEPLHELCATCMSKGIKTILQPINQYFLRCETCQSSIQVNHMPPPTTRTRS